MTRARAGEGVPWQRSKDRRWAVGVRGLDGRRKILYASTRDALLAKRDEHVAAVRVGLAPTPGRLTVGRVLADWLDDRRSRVRASTWASYELHVRMHLHALHGIPLVRLTPADVRTLVRDREAARCAPRTVAYTLAVLRMALGQAMRDGLIARNVAKLVTAPRKARSELTTWTPAEASRFLAGAEDDSLYALWAVLLGTGMRLGEALALRRQDVAQGRVTVAGSVSLVRGICRSGPKAARLVVDAPKTDAGWRTIGLPAFASRAIAAHMAGTEVLHLQGYVFTGERRHGLVDGRWVNRRFMALVAQLGLPRVRLHDLRHTAASLMLAQGYTLFDVSKVLGHASIVQTADTYGHLVNERSAAIAADMDRLLAAR